MPSSPVMGHPSPVLPQEYSVSEIAYNIKSTLEQTFPRVRVRGELSGTKLHTSGHLYCSLKDAQAVLDGVCWRGVVSTLSFKPVDGMEVIATGRVTSYAGRSKYQIVIESLQVAGQGVLLKTLEDRRRSLAAEGLFDADRKKLLPFLPRSIGVITSATGAVISDILHRLRDRCPVPVLLWPVLVQGEGAADQITAAIQGMNRLPLQGEGARPDLIIVARGGGSLEDLWCFNEENVVRAAAASEIPLISAVGHETDTTLIDYAADWRAPTPTAAAERAVPVRADLCTTLQGLARNSHFALKRLVEEGMQRCDERSHRLEQWQSLYEDRLRQTLEALRLRLRQPQEQFALAAHQLQPLKNQLGRLGQRILQDHQNRLNQGGALLESFSYHNTLKRGFCTVRDDAQRLVTSKASALKHAKMTLMFHDGDVDILSEKIV